MRRSLICLTVLLNVATVHAASIQLNPTSSSASETPFVWTGPYFGLHAGFVSANQDEENFMILGPAHYQDFGGSGGVAGLHVGYNYQLDSNVVIGVEGDLEYTGLYEYIEYGQNFNKLYEKDGFKSNLQGSARFRLGYSFENFLPYVTAGLAFANQQDSAFAVYWYGDEYFNAKKLTRTGWTVGGGAEYALSEHWTLRAEGRYTDFGSERFVFDANSFGEENATESRFNEFSTNFGISYKF